MAARLSRDEREGIDLAWKEFGWVSRAPVFERDIPEYSASSDVHCHVRTSAKARHRLPKPLRRSLETGTPTPFGGGGLGSVLQTRLMDVAGDAQTLAAALNHSAFNTANALGPLLGGLAIAAGYGWTSTGWVGMGLSLGGFAIFVIAWAVGRARVPASA